MNQVGKRNGWAGGKGDHHLWFEVSPKRVRAIINGQTVADSLATGLMLETNHRPVYYFPREAVRADLLERSNHRTHCPYKGDASYWTITVDGKRLENALWSYETPIPEMAAIAGRLAFYGDKVDRWFEEDEEVFGHPRDPYHRIDVRASERRVRIFFGGEAVADSSRARFLYETGLPTRYYLPQQDVRMELLQATQKHTVCPYKGTASYWSLRRGEAVAEDAVWSYLDPLPDMPLIKGLLCFYLEKVERIEVAGETV
jgi:uncharacterized protein (DUF427 family)